ncbi:MAG TPA: molybdenum cofactor biosynthesis protein MoaE [Bryobacteraceae bacterium]|nr:molybdenum cofactor biosynthesis protein MoaE [Bryobacteraceae bacterium]
MVVRVLFFGVLRDLTGLQEELADIPAGTTVSALFGNYASRFETLAEARPSILFARNQEFVSGETELTERDEVAFLPPVSGGSQPSSAIESGEDYFLTSERDSHFFALTRRPIDSSALARRLQKPEDGAVIVFEGVVRNNTKGRATNHLEYECYEPMAIRRMEEIGVEIASAHAIGRIAMVHRLGRLEIGEASVSIVATAPHRQPAFQAALDGINRLKREVPIWKKEFFEDGAVWVEGEWDENLPGRQKISR